MKHQKGWAALSALLLVGLVVVGLVVGTTGCDRAPGDSNEQAGTNDGGFGDAGPNGDGGQSDALPTGCGDATACLPGEICVDDVCQPADECDPPCSGGLVCEDRECVAPCRDDADCDMGEVCDRDTGLCQPDDDACNSVTCPEGFHCESDGNGGVSCVPDECSPECPTGQLCVNGECQLSDRPDECREDGDCEAGFHCDTSGDPNICREGDPGCDPECPDGQVCVNGECTAYCTREEFERDRCCDALGELCCVCDGTPEQREACARRQAQGENLCPPACDCDFVDTCSAEEWLACEASRCDCNDPARVGNCPDDAACACVCGDPTFGRFCTEAECAPDPACDCSDRSTFGSCTEQELAACACVCVSGLHCDGDDFAAGGICSDCPGDPEGCEPPRVECDCSDPSTFGACVEDGVTCQCDCDSGLHCVPADFADGGQCSACPGDPEGCNPPAPECDCSTGANCDGTEACACDCEASPAAIGFFCGPDECAPPVCDCQDPVGTGCQPNQCDCRCSWPADVQARFCSEEETRDADGDGVINHCDERCDVLISVTADDEGRRFAKLSRVDQGPLGLGGNCATFGLTRFRGEVAPAACNEQGAFCSQMTQREVNNRTDAFGRSEGFLTAPLIAQPCGPNPGSPAGVDVAFGYWFMYWAYESRGACWPVEEPQYLTPLDIEIDWQSVNVCEAPNGGQYFVVHDVACQPGDRRLVSDNDR